MTDSELGFYHRCLNRSWINSGIPADLDELARAMRVSRAYLNKVWERVGKRFEPSVINPLMLVNRRQELERAHASSKSERATASVRTRYERRTNVVPRARARPDSDSGSDSSLGGAGGDDPEQTIAHWMRQYCQIMGVTLEPDLKAVFRISRAMLLAGKKLDDVEAIFQELIETKQKPKGIGWMITVLEAKLGGGIHAA